MVVGAPYAPRSDSDVVDLALHDTFMPVWRKRGVYRGSGVVVGIAVRRRSTNSRRLRRRVQHRVTKYWFPVSWCPWRRHVDISKGDGDVAAGDKVRSRTGGHSRSLRRAWSAARLVAEVVRNA